MTKSVTFRLSDSDIELLEAIAAEKKNKTDAIRYALQQAEKALHGEAQEKEEGSKVLDVLTEQLRVKDEQIKDLSRALERAQTLHHEEKEPKQLETAEVNMTRWQRFAKWLKG